jgi:WhiB family redox-sensing transcriptional regulator
MTERERRALLRKRPEVGSWRQVLEEARDAYLERTGGVLIIPEAAPALPRQREMVEVGVDGEVLLEAFEPEPVAAG